MDYVDGGDLDEAIEKKKKAMTKAKGVDKYWSEERVLHMFTQVCLGLKHLHDRKILHRDIKAQNVFMTKAGILKLGDLGMCTLLSNTVARAKTFVGTPYYIAPEIIKGKRYSFEADIWSMGILLYEMCALCYPFDSESGSSKELYKNICAGYYDELPGHLQDNLPLLVKMMMH